MKQTLFSLFFIAMVGVLGITTAQAQTTNQVELDVKGMTCKGCEYKVKQSLKEINGVVSTETVSHESGKVVINIDPAITDKEAVAKALAKSTGYTVSTNAGNKAEVGAKAGCDPAKCTKTKEECAKEMAEGKPCCSSKAKAKSSCDKTK